MIDFEKIMKIINQKAQNTDSIEEKDYYAVCANILEYINGIGEEFVNFDIDFIDNELNIRIKRK